MLATPAAIPRVTDEKASGVATRRGDLAAGARAMAPWLIGIAPYGLVIGVSSARADVPTLAGWLTGPLIYSGSSQVAAIQLLDAGAAPLVVITSALAINLRLVLYSATMAHHWRDAPRWWQALAAYLLVDPSLAVGVDGYERTGDRHRGHLHYLGGAVLLWAVWLAAIGVGATAGARLPNPGSAVDGHMTRVERGKVLVRELRVL
jgi:predicted branched-subunit amino acid permease